MAKGNSFIRVAFVVLAAVAQRSSAALGPESSLDIVNRVIAPDGFTRNTVLAGGTFPGPVIAGYTGDEFKIDVQDKLEDPSMLTPTSIHWHGILQHTTNWADGGAFVSQCPITTGNSFTYKFNTNGISGTYWYHSHLETQYCDGLRGPLVLYDRNDPYKGMYDVDDESTIITLADWYHLPAPVIAGRPGPPRADSTLINGLGRFWSNPTAELAVIKVTHGKSYRFRLINIACDPNYVFTIAGHNLTVIEADGQNTEPLTVDEIQIFAAQRYSFVLKADQAIDNYWIRALPNVMSNDSALGSANGINSAILRYEGALEQEPTHPEFQSTNPLYEWNLHSLTDTEAPGEPYVGGVDYALNILVDSTLPNVAIPFRFFVNGVSLELPSVPVLLQILSGVQLAQDLLPKGSIYGLARGATVELTIPGGTVGAPHPFHLHGHAFSVVRSANSTVSNYKNPVKRDVVNTGISTTDNVTIRFRADNPGPWFLHCHIDWHLNVGLGIIFAEDVPAVPLVDPAPQEWYNLCPEYEASLARDLALGSNQTVTPA